MMTSRHSGVRSTGGRREEVQLGCGNMYSLNINEQCTTCWAGYKVK